MATDQPERLQKIIAGAGLASRRKAEELITSGRVRVNGRLVTELGTKAHPYKDRIEVDGRRVVTAKPAYYVLHKPREVVSTMEDPEGRATVRELVDRIPQRVFPVGRLDYHTSGVLLLTNDGELSEALLRPRTRVPKVYAAKLRGHLDEDALHALRNGIVLDDGTNARAADVFVLREEQRHSWLQITLTEGKNRQIHRMADAIGHPVMRLARTAFADITVDGLRPGQYRELKGKEIERLKSRYATPWRRKKRKEARHQEAAQEEVELGGADPGDDVEPQIPDEG